MAAAAAFCLCALQQLIMQEKRSSATPPLRSLQPVHLLHGEARVTSIAC